MILYEHLIQCQLRCLRRHFSYWPQRLMWHIRGICIPNTERYNPMPYNAKPLHLNQIWISFFTNKSCFTFFNNPSFLYIYVYNFYFRSTCTCRRFLIEITMETMILYLSHQKMWVWKWTLWNTHYIIFNQLTILHSFFRFD